MKICFLNIYSGLVARGAETFVHEVANRLSVDHEVTVVQGGHSLGDEKYEVLNIPYNKDWQTLPEYGEPWSLEYYIKHLLFDVLGLHICLFTLKTVLFLLKERPQIAVPVNGRWQSVILRLVTWSYGGKMVISGQSGIGRDDVWNLWNFPNAFVALSTFAKNWAEKKNPFVKVKYIPNGVDTSKFTPKGIAIEPIIKKPIVLFVGALEEGKRPLHAIKAVSQMKTKANLLITGFGNLRWEIEKLAEEVLGKMGSRYSIKHFRHAAMPKVYREANVFTIPSKSYYSFEIVLLEAMASGLPVVTNDDPIRREIVGNAGLFVDPDNIGEYAKTLDKALAAKWGDKPRKQAEKFSWDEIAKKYEQLFLSLI